VEHQPPASQHAREVVIERLRIQLSGDAEARRVVQDRVHRSIRQRDDLLGDVALRQRQGAARLRRPRVEAAQPEHVGVLLIRQHLR